MKKYSVLMSLYKDEKPEYFRLAIDSMLNQTLQPDEIVIVKDGTLPSELEVILEEYVMCYPKIMHVVGYEQNQGLGVALNFGIRHCKNDLIARMDTDDISTLDRCQKQIEIFEKFPEVDIVGGHIAEFIDETTNIISVRKVPLTHEEITIYLKKRCPFNHVAVMFKKSAVMAAGNYKEWHFNDDYYLWIRMHLFKAHFYNLDSILVFVRVGNEMYSRRGGRNYFKSEKNLQKFMLLKGLISKKVYIVNVLQRFIVQIVLPNKVRAWVYKKLIREKVGDI